MSLLLFFVLQKLLLTNSRESRLTIFSKSPLTTHENYFHFSKSPLTTHEKTWHFLKGMMSFHDVKSWKNALRETSRNPRKTNKICKSFQHSIIPSQSFTFGGNFKRIKIWSKKIPVGRSCRVLSTDLLVPWTTRGTKY